MDAPSDRPATTTPPQPAWKLTWLTPPRCRAIVAALIVFGFVAHLRYLRHDCPIDLSGDEAQYWDWSRALDWSYYSKGPLVAYIIRASCAVFGDQMWAVRLPALVIAAATTGLTYWLTRRLFGSDRLALGAVLLNHVVPMFVAGSMLMTIDPPYFFCWGLACAFLALATLDERKWAWIGIGIAVGVGTLAKYGMLLWPIGMICFCLLDPASRKWLRTPWPWVAITITLLFLTPLVVWNIRHDWVTWKHVIRQTGAANQDHFLNGNVLEFVGSQIGVLGPALAVILIGAIVYAFRRQRALRQRPSPLPSPTSNNAAREGGAIERLRERETGARADRAVLLLLWTGLPLFALCLLGSIRSKMQVNWPAAAYFPWMILAAYFLSTRLASRAAWRPWRGWLWAAVIFGVAFSPIAHDTALLYPLIPVLNKFSKKHDVDVQTIDMTYKLKGWQQLGRRVTRELASLHDPIVIGRDYMETAELAFYVACQPKTYCVGPYITRLDDRKRRSQYDVWPDRNLNQPALRHRDAIYVGYINDDILHAFKSVEELPDETIYQRGYKVRRFKIYRCRDFQGLELKEPSGA